MIMIFRFSLGKGEGSDDLRGALAGKTEVLAIEVERLERRGDRDRGVRGLDRFTEEARWVLAEDLQLEPFRCALDQVGELVAVVSDKVGELDQFEVEVDQRVALLRNPVLDLPADVFDEESLPFGALAEEESRSGSQSACVEANAGRAVPAAVLHRHALVQRRRQVVEVPPELIEEISHPSRSQPRPVRC